MTDARAWRGMVCALVLCGTLAAPAAVARADTELFVAPNGSDSAAGTQAAPFKTIARAQQAVRVALPSATAPIAVRLRAGTYYLDQTLRFGPADSGTAAAPVSYAAFPGESPTVSGAIPVTPTWTSEQAAWLTTDRTVAVAQLDPGLDFDQLLINGQRQVMARYPNFQAGQILDGYAADALSASRVARWSNPTTGFVRGLHGNQWGGNSFKITGVQNGQAQLQWVGDNNRGSTLHATYRMVENLKEELDAPGEWFYDRDTGKLYFKSPAGLDLTGARVELAHLDELIHVEGTDASHPVEHLALSGLTFTGTHRTLFDTPYEPLQLGDWAIARAAAIHLKKTRDITISSSTFDQLGGNGVLIDGYGASDRIRDNSFHDGGASDVLTVGSRDAVREPSTWDNMRTTPGDLTPGPKTEDYPRDIEISGNHMFNFGRFEKQTSGVQISMSRRVTVTGNTIHHGPRACVNINDGTWGGHLIQDNDIFECVLETSDHGSINAWGRDRYWPWNATAATKKQYAFLDAIDTTVIQHNRIWHNSEWGIDLDDGSSNYVMRDNLIRNAGIKLREGFKRLIQNNIIVNGAVHNHVSFANADDRVERNVFLTPNPYEFIQSDPATSGEVFDYNLFWNDGKSIQDVTDAWRAAGRDTHSVIADPKLAGPSPWVNPATLDFTLAAGSPALSLGFVQFPMTGFGRPGAPTPPAVIWRAEPATPADEAESTPEPWLGASVSNISTDQIASAVGLGDRNGLYVASVPAGSYAEAQGLKPNDVVRQFGASTVTTKQSFWLAYNKVAPGTGVTLQVWRNQAATALTLHKPFGSERLNDTSGVVYNGAGWEYKNPGRGGSGGYLNNVYATQANGDSFSFTFYGDGIDYIAQTNTDEGKVAISIDGGPATTIDNKTPTRLHQQVVFSKRDLAFGLHTITGTKLDGGYLIADGFRVYGTALVSVSAEAPVGGSVPPTLALTLGTPASFGTFVPGVTADYAASMTANVVSSAADAALSVADPSGTATRHLVNGSFSLPQPLRVAGDGGALVPVGGSANPTALRSYDGPVSNDTVAINLAQSIGATDALRTGGYSKTLTFTLSTTTP